MVLDRDIRLTILGNTGVGKTSLIKRLKGEDPTMTEKTMDIIVEKKKITLLSSSRQSKLSLERYRKYNVIAVDNPGDFKLRRKWRDAMRKYKTDGILFMLDPSQGIESQRVAMEDSFNYFLDSLSLDPDKADKKAKKKKTLFFFVVNKMDTIDNDEEKAKIFLENFDTVIEDYKMTFLFAKFAQAFISVHKSPYEEIDSIFEKCKQALY
ncbi:MAG: GTPase domain-containing protein [Candidatus Heimdallarchaeota archaeon]|nr:MAG: GTPase domain-containing protein [Candidatus Heimdallarchaeota archaeon]